MIEVMRGARYPGKQKYAFRTNQTSVPVRSSAREAEAGEDFAGLGGAPVQELIRNRFSLCTDPQRPGACRTMYDATMS